MKTIRWGMIGCGDVTEVKSGPGFYKSNNSMLYGVTNRTIPKAYDYASRHNVQKVFENAEELINDENIDAVYIGTPPNSHKQYALMCANANKVCYIEKPLAMNYEESLEIYNAFKSKNLKAFISYYRRKLEKFEKVKELIDNNSIGDIRCVNVILYRKSHQSEIEGSWRVNPEISGGGIFMDVAVHTLDILDYLIGEIEEAKSFSANQAHLYKPEDIVSACFKFKNGVIGNGTWCFTTFKLTDEIKIVGDKGNITFDCFGDAPIIIETINETKQIQIEYPPHVHQNLIQSIVDDLNGISECPCTLDTALRTAKVCKMIFED